MPLPLIPPADGKNHLTFPDGTRDVAFSWQPEMRQEIDVKTALLHMDGRTWPLAYFGEHTDESWDVTFLIDTVSDGDQWANLRAIVDGANRGSVLVWTDVFGNQFNCVVSASPVAREMVIGGVPTTVAGRPQGGRFQKVRLKITRVA